jgi:1-acyl-sn-glycerol-3-phosphate acyltransferase
MNSIIDFVKTFLLYITLPLRVLFFVFLAIFCNFIFSFLKDESSIMGMILISCKLFMFVLSLNINISKEDLMKYMKYLYSDQKLICTFNHTTFIDGFVLCSAFPRSCYVILKLIFHSLLCYSDQNHEKFGNIYVEKGKTSKTIKERVDNRKAGDPIVFIAPGSGNTPQIPGNITEFTGSGAFVEGYPILPIVIKYEDDSLHHNHDNGESMIHSCLKLFLVQNYKINIKVCDLVEKIEGEAIEQYKDRVFDIMNETYKNM